MLSHSILVMSLKKFVNQINQWYEYSLIHHGLTRIGGFFSRQRKSSKVFAWGHSFFKILGQSKTYQLLKLFFQGINTVILWSHERLINFNANSVLLQTMNNFGAKETRGMSYLLVCGGFGFGLLVNFILKRQTFALLGLLPLGILVVSLLDLVHLKIDVSKSYTYRIFKHALKLFSLDQEEI